MAWVENRWVFDLDCDDVAALPPWAQNTPFSA